jgi:pimeloyl-ACP methyl ester carboxylesterase
LKVSMDKIIHLKDGRALAYTETGELSYKPIFFFHGNPGSRLIRHPDESIAQGLRVRLIIPDRPGFGLSDFKSNRTLLNSVDDLEELANSLGIDTFAVCGVSAGGPYCAACACKLPHRVTQAVIVSGVAPMDRKGCYKGMHPLWRITFAASKYLPFKLLQLLVWIQSRKILSKPDESVESFASILSDSDKEILSRPEVKKQFITNQSEAIARGVKGWTHEAKILISPWKIPFEDIKTSVHLWYWENDVIAPLQMGKYLKSKIPHAHAHFLPQGGHFSIFDHWEAILRSALS